MQRDANHMPRKAGRGGRLTGSPTSSTQSSLASTDRSCSRPPGCWRCRHALLQGSRCHSTPLPHSGTLHPNTHLTLTLTAHSRALLPGRTRSLPSEYSGGLLWCFPDCSLQAHCQHWSSALHGVASTRTHPEASHLWKALQEVQKRH